MVKKGFHISFRGGRSALEMGLGREGEERMGWVKDHLAVVEVAGAMTEGCMNELLWRQVLARPLEMNAVPEIRPINVPLSR